MPQLNDINVICVAGTILRIGLLTDLTPLMLSKYCQSSALQSILYDPRFTLENLKEISFISKYGSMSATNNKGNLLISTIVENIISRTPNFDHELLFSVIAILLDLAITCQLYRLAKKYYAIRTDHMKWEMVMEQNMPFSINPITCSPHRRNLFGSRFDDFEEVSGLPLPSTALFAASNIPALSAMVYYLNPASILTSAGGTGSVQGVCFLLFVSSLLQALEGNASMSGICIAILCHLDINNIIFLVPSALLWKHHLNARKPSKPSLPFFFLSFLLSFTAINVAAAHLGQNFTWDFFKQTYDLTRYFEDLTPNLGVSWYLAMNIFTRYKEYFNVLCSGFIFLFCGPMLLRFSYYPLEMVTALQLLRTLFTPRPTLQDIAFAFALMTMSRRTLARMGTSSVIALLALPVPIILYVIDYWLWLQSGSGNANYMFFQCIAYNLFIGIIALDFVASTLKRDKALHLTDKKLKQS